MTESNHETRLPGDDDEPLLSRLQRLEKENQEYRALSESRVLQAELKVHALSAGMIDLDGLKLLEIDEGAPAEPEELVRHLKRVKPWLFSTSTSSAANAPPSKSSPPKLATEMNDEEYRVARADILRRSAL